nr:hypothetical protein [Haloterrigena salifodinae]
MSGSSRVGIGEGGSGEPLVHILEDDERLALFTLPVDGHSG